jgi:hypothetical protein
MPGMMKKLKYQILNDGALAYLKQVIVKPGTLQYKQHHNKTPKKVKREKATCFRFHVER